MNSSWVVSSQALLQSLQLSILAFLKKKKRMYQSHHSLSMKAITSLEAIFAEQSSDPYVQSRINAQSTIYLPHVPYEKSINLDKS